MQALWSQDILFVLLYPKQLERYLKHTMYSINIFSVNELMNGWNTDLVDNEHIFEVQEIEHWPPLAAFEEGVTWIK